MKTIKQALILTLIFSANAYAGEDWFCKSQASQRRGDSILACGIGYDISEAEARIKAFSAANDEFNKLCTMSDDCKGMEVVTQPKRTDCELADNVYKCYRLVEFEIEIPKGENDKRLKTGMSVDKLVDVVGAPTSVAQIHDYLEGTVMQQLFYTSAVCAYRTCSAIIKNKKIVKFQDFKISLVGF